jgi:hypothetical protein
MKYDIKVIENILEIKVSLPRRSSSEEEIERVGVPTINRLASEAALPKGSKLGECLHPIFGINNFDDAVTGTWIFDILTESAKKPNTKAATDNKKSKRRKTSSAKNKTGEK